MTRLSKKARRRAQSPRKCKDPFPKTGPKKDKLDKGFKELDNGFNGTALAGKAYFGKI